MDPLPHPTPKIPGSSRYVKFLPFGRFFGWKGTNFTHLEDPGMLVLFLWMICGSFFFSHFQWQFFWMPWLELLHFCVFEDSSESGGIFLDLFFFWPAENGSLWTIRCFHWFLTGSWLYSPMLKTCCNPNKNKQTWRHIFLILFGKDQYGIFFSPVIFCEFIGKSHRFPIGFQVWLGTSDDWVGITDQPSKIQGTGVTLPLFP